MRIRIPTKIELVIQGFIGALLVLMLVDVFQALDATACTDPQPSQNCYPWGGTEGPSGGSWSYSSKAHYLTASGVGIFVLTIAALAPFFVRNRRGSLITLIGLPVLGRIAAWLGIG
ncbi:hypothetical protein GGR34_002946 [Microvirga flocculans]|uniref:Uncharacterized protein n=1 Tax=Microvirga flocculans TaxID=217168 RepID=A0A7W6IHJ7_9HYPH|nr:hypothetical protein [Microvirga flocculans]MBB4041276.1 hypothetical protein [Microvirga flocculans]